MSLFANQGLFLSSYPRFGYCDSYHKAINEISFNDYIKTKGSKRQTVWTVFMHQLLK